MTGADGTARSGVEIFGGNKKLDLNTRAVRITGGVRWIWNARESAGFGLGLNLWSRTSPGNLSFGCACGHWIWMRTGALDLDVIGGALGSCGC
ncbi:hypothetical protein LguiB_021791 [Lonicera macranthoides]